MIPEVVSTFLESPSENTMRKLLDSKSVFWVDWGEEDDAIVEYCESVLQTGALSSKFLDADNEAGFELLIHCNSLRTVVPLTISPADRHITICSLNEVLAPDYEIRFCIDSNGMDTLAFLPLASADWTDIETKYADLFATHFGQVTPFPNLFTEGYGAINWRDLAHDPKQKMAAIKVYREQNNCSIGEAKSAVEAYLR